MDDNNKNLNTPEPENTEENKIAENTIKEAVEETVENTADTQETTAPQPSPQEEPAAPQPNAPTPPPVQQDAPQNNYYPPQNNTDPNQQYQGGYYQNPQGYQYPPYAAEPMPPVEKKANVGLAILSFLFPIVGLIIFLVKKTEKPKTAKACGVCALVSFIIQIIISIVIFAASSLLVGSAVKEELENDPDFSKLEDYLDDYVANYGDYDNANETPNVIEGNTIGDYTCAITSSRIVKNLEGNNSLMLDITFTNNSTSHVSFFSEIDIMASQNDVVLLSTSLPDKDYDDDIYEIVAPGESEDIEMAFLLNDTTSPVLVETSEFLSDSNEKLQQTIELK